MTDHPADYDEKRAAGGFWMSNRVAAGLFFALVVILVVIAATYANVSHGAAVTTSETRNVARCSFLFTAYRAQLNQQGGNSSVRPVIGPNGKPLDPLAGLTLPPIQQIHLGSNCQKYLKTFVASQKGTP